MYEWLYQHKGHQPSSAYVDDPQGLKLLPRLQLNMEGAATRPAQGSNQLPRSSRL